MNKKIKKMLIVELGILFLVLIIYIAIKTNLIGIIPKCLIKSIIGIDCPSCGGTRCVISFLQGRFLESFLYHPIFFLTIIYLIFVNILFIINAFRKKSIGEFLYPKTIFWIIFIIILLVFTIIRNII